MVISGQLYVDPESLNLKVEWGQTVLRTVNHLNLKPCLSGFENLGISFVNSCAVFLTFRRKVYGVNYVLMKRFLFTGSELNFISKKYSANVKHSVCMVCEYKQIHLNH